jgi:phosphoribosylanthranilate isomerase
LSPNAAPPNQSPIGPDVKRNRTSVKVKICGLTNLEDARQAAGAGADFLGFVLWVASKRAVTIEVVRTIANQLRAEPKCPLLIGVFVNERVETMAEVMDACRLDLAQLSGEEVPAVIGEPDSPIYGRSYKALRPTTLAEAEAEAEWYLPPQPASGHPALLIDAYHPTLKGGTGQMSDWSIAADLAKSIPGMMLAGGLRPDNVADAVHQVRPFAVDVASGVEASPGRKNPALVRAFISAAKGAR